MFFVLLVDGVSKRSSAPSISFVVGIVIGLGFALV